MQCPLRQGARGKLRQSSGKKSQVKKLPRETLSLPIMDHEALVLVVANRGPWAAAHPIADDRGLHGDQLSIIVEVVREVDYFTV
jgi:hypothetical protein